MDENLKQMLREHIRKAAAMINRDAFGQEPNYTAALFGKLSGEVFQTENGQYVKVSCSVSNDRGPGSAESLTGIDIGIVITWVDDAGGESEKAVLLQAKNNPNKLSKNEQKDLMNQCEKMRAISDYYVVMDCPREGSVPNVYGKKESSPWWGPPPKPLDEYLVNHVLECKEGDWRSHVVEIARRSDRLCLRIKTNAPRPRLAPKAKGSRRP